MEQIFEFLIFFRKYHRLPYRTKFCLTKFSSDKTFRRTKFSTPSRNFDNFIQFLTDFCIEILDKIFSGKNFSSDKIFDTKPEFRQFCSTNFCPIRYKCIPLQPLKSLKAIPNLSNGLYLKCTFLRYR